MSNTDFELLTRWCLEIDDAAGAILRGRHDPWLQTIFRETFESALEFLEDTWRAVRKIWSCEQTRRAIARQHSFREGLLGPAANGVLRERQRYVAPVARTFESEKIGDISDYELLAHWIRARDAGACTELYKRYRGTFWRFFSNKLSAESVLEDLIQEVFFQLLRKTEIPFDDPAKVRPYLIGIAWNLLKKEFRARARRANHVHWDDVANLVEHLSTYMVLEPGITTIMEREQNRQRICEALKKLPLAHQTALELKYWENLTDEQVAEHMSEKLGTVKCWIRKGKLRLKTILAEYQDGPGIVSPA